jgi:hypothetical protein
MDKAVDQRAYRTFAGRDIFVLFFFIIILYICLICWMSLNDAFLSSEDIKEWTGILGISDEKS